MSEPRPRQEPQDAIPRLPAEERMPGHPCRVAIVTGVATVKASLEAAVCPGGPH